MIIIESLTIVIHERFNDNYDYPPGIRHSNGNFPFPLVVIDPQIRYVFPLLRLIAGVDSNDNNGFQPD